MTVAVSVTVMDGIALATDSAASIVGPNKAVSYIYENANKVFHLHRHLPIAAMCWGVAAFKNNSVETIMKDFRVELMGDIGASSVPLSDVAKKLRSRLYDDHYLRSFGSPDGKSNRPVFGTRVVGFSPNQKTPESFVIQIDDKGNCPDPRHDPSIPSIGVHASPIFAMRLLTGVDAAVPSIMKQVGIEDGLITKFRNAAQGLSIPIIHPAMPIQDAIELSEFLVDLTIKSVRFSPGPPVVGGPIELAAVTRHEGFKWVRRKHYYETLLNPHSKQP